MYALTITLTVTRVILLLFIEMYARLNEQLVQRGGLGE